MVAVKSKRNIFEKANTRMEAPQFCFLKMNRLDFRKMISAIFTENEVMLIMTAYDYSKAAHRTQSRQEFGPDAPDNKKRYFNHPKHLAIQMIKDGVKDAKTVCEAFLHDCPEDTAIFGNQLTEGYEIAMKDAFFRLSKSFDPEVATDVILLTLPLPNPAIKMFASKNQCLEFYKTRLSDPETSKRVLLVKLYDRLHNMDTIEVKSLQTALLKIKETEEFYIPLFIKRFLDDKSPLSLIGTGKLVELIDLVIRKKNQIELTYNANKS